MVQKHVVTLRNFSEIAELLGLQTRQVEGLFNNNRASFTDKHTRLEASPGKKMKHRMFTELGFTRLKVLGAFLIRQKEKKEAIDRKNAEHNLAAVAAEAEKNKPFSLEDHCDGIAGLRAGVGLAPPDVRPKPTLVKAKEVAESDEPDIFKTAAAALDEDEILNIASRIVSDRKKIKKLEEELDYYKKAALCYKKILGDTYVAIQRMEFQI